MDMTVPEILVGWLKNYNLTVTIITRRNPTGFLLYFCRDRISDHRQSL